MDSSTFGILVLIAMIPVVVVNIVQDNRRKQEEPQIVKTAIVDVDRGYISETRTRTGSAVGRAIIGGKLGGALGAATGAATARRSTITTSNDRVIFKIWWENGTTSIKEVRRNSGDYKLYIRYVED